MHETLGFATGEHIDYTGLIQAGSAPTLPVNFDLEFSMADGTIQKKASYDFYLILATAAVLFIISLICIYGMFYFKWAQIQQMAPAQKFLYMNRMNSVVAPFLIALIIILSVCVPKRLLPVRYLNLFAFGLLVIISLVALLRTGREALLLALSASLVLQLIVLGLAVMGSRRLNFEKSGYWLRVGSSLIHLGLIMFVLDLFFYRQQTLHLFLFWLTTIATVFGMIFSFYAQGVANLLAGKKNDEGDVSRRRHEQHLPGGSS